jgi:hypothetical protein
MEALEKVKLNDLHIGRITGFSMGHATNRVGWRPFLNRSLFEWISLRFTANLANGLLTLT